MVNNEGSSSSSSREPPKQAAARGGSSTGIFFRQDDGSVTSSFLFLMLAFALWCAKQYSWAFASLLVSGILATCTAMQEMQEVDKLEIRFNVMEALDVVHEMIDWERQLRVLMQHQQQQASSSSSSSSAARSTESHRDKNDDNTNQQQHQQEPDNSIQFQEQHSKAHLVIRIGLLALAKKYGKFQQETKKKKKRKHETSMSGNHRSRPAPNTNNNAASDSDSDTNDDELALLCQQASYIGFRTFADDDTIVSLSLSLLALVAKNRCVQDRTLHSADEYGLNVPIECLQHALRRAKNDNNGDDRTNEQQLAELQRKRCLLLGAISEHGTSDMASLVVQEGGLQVVLEALDWFRYHADVTNWALWALFTVCYENNSHKMALVQLQGIPLILQAIRNCPDSVEVARHGTAILFDLLREEEDDNDATLIRQHQPQSSSQSIKLDVWKIRNVALEHGLHSALLQAMNHFSTEMDIMMMSQEILIGTNYQGDDIPQYHPTRW